MERPNNLQQGKIPKHVMANNELNIKYVGTGEVVQWLDALALLPEGLSLMSSAQVVVSCPMGAGNQTQVLCKSHKCS